MTVFSAYLKRFIARPWMVGLTIALPVLIVLVVSAGETEGRLRVALVDHDGSFLSGLVRDALEPVALFLDIREEEMANALVEGRIEYGLVIPSGMQAAVVAGERARLEASSLQGVQMTRTVRSAADAVLSAAHNVALHTGGDAERFESTMLRVRDGEFKLWIDTYRAETGALGTNAAAGVSQLLAMLTLTMLLATMGTCLMFLKDVESGMLHRTIAGPLSVMRYMLETNLAFFAVVVLQAIAASVALRVAVPQLSTTALLIVGATLSTFALVAVSFTLAVANTMKTVKRTAIVTNFLILPMVMLGGAFWPFDIMPEHLQRIGAFSPTRWTTVATESALSGGSLVDVLPQLGVLVLFAIVFQLLGSWRRVDVTR